MSAALLLFATYISISTPRVVLEHVEVIDGTGAAPISSRSSYPPVASSRTARS